ncbi:(1-3)-beta-glucanase [Acanthocystis turfacea Chlorella virus OR0704.3]|nr:(1-3)-beta-glucanase [Acanthocystis turfacea Chlorella virus Can0610SP]AGE59595.1 (1-3)-beta-glucanase [Acanthocystis turfacea Chlorella virus OR0704.3]
MYVIFSTSRCKMKSSVKIVLSTIALFSIVGISVGLALGLRSNTTYETEVMPDSSKFPFKEYEEVSQGPVDPFFIYQTTQDTSDVSYLTNITSLVPTIPTVRTSTTGIHVPIWWDDFNGTELNKNTWDVPDGGSQSGWGNDEIQTYYGANVAVENGYLYIISKREESGEWSSGRVSTKGAWYPGMNLPSYGTATKIYFEAKITVPDSGTGLWPSFWAFPSGSEYGKFSQSGALDIMELRDDYGNLTQGIHYGGERPANKKTMVRVGDMEPGFTLANKTFIFSVEWSNTDIVFLWNGVETGRLAPRALDEKYGWYSDAAPGNVNAPFDKPFYAVFNIAVGGIFPSKPADNTPSRGVMAVDYFRVYADYIDVSS